MGEGRGGGTGGVSCHLHHLDVSVVFVMFYKQDASPGDETGSIFWENDNERYQEKS